MTGFRDPISIKEEGQAAPDPSLELVHQPRARTIFIRGGEWRTGGGLPPAQLSAWLRRRRARELCILAMLSEHRYLTTDQLRELFFPGRTERAAQKHLRWMAAEMGLVARWQQVEPVIGGLTPTPRIGGWRWRPSVYLLTERGATVLAHSRGVEAGPLTRRAFFAAEHVYRLEHDLETNAFWVDLAAASRELADQGLYHWVGDDAMHRTFQEQGADLAPDGWGRYLTASTEVLFLLEWDRGTEAAQRISRKARGYLDHYAGRSSEHNHLVLVAPTPTREASVRNAIARELRGVRPVRFWTTTTGLLQQLGPLGDVWAEVGVPDRPRSPLAVLPGLGRSGRRVEDCIGKPAWWERRPGGGDSA